ncbi:hypothetical protein BOX37_29205 [Nocardia mangyaensis]|uniref:Uncharacterized protein n=1 Tax=Nocardia mangyaensis TaxID=2213200 RepID=A0A1J0VZC3_9NOCA|nr:hypothetical protein BOX37_29205 [Nocardia mangyaensis]
MTATPPAGELLDPVAGVPYPIQRCVEFAFDVQFAARVEVRSRTFDDPWTRSEPDYYALS